MNPKKIDGVEVWKQLEDVLAPPTRDHCLDHVVPVAKGGTNSYRNLVSCCMDCNSRKRDTSAPDFLRSLYREGELSRKELTRRLAALRALAAGILRPQVPAERM